MTNRLTKFAAVVAPAALLLGAGTPADAKVLVMGDGGWEVSFDGSVNVFYVFNDNEELSGGSVSSRGTSIADSGEAAESDSSRIRTGLLPAVFGINIKAPTTGGLDMGSRIGLYPQINNASTKTAFFGPPGTRSAGAQIDMREIFFTVDGSWGQLLAGRTLSLFQGKNIVLDMTLFGVGGVAGTGRGGGTTLGRIGLGYVYPDFNGRLQYTTPDMNGFKVAVGAFDPSVIGDSVGAAGNPFNVGLTASETDTPRFEGEASWAGSMGGSDVTLWVNGMWQDAEFLPSDIGSVTVPSITLDGRTFTAPTAGSDVTSWGFGGGLQFGVPIGAASLNLVGSGYVGEALGSTFMLDFDPNDAMGEERDHWGFYGQGVLAFGQGTSIGVSYGGNFADETDLEEALRREGTFAALEEQSLFDVMIWHEINPNFRIIAEYGRQTSEWEDGADVDKNIFSIGTFFFW